MKSNVEDTAVGAWTRSQKSASSISNECIAWSIHNTKFYETQVQNIQDKQRDMILSEISLLRTVKGIHLKDQGNSDKIETEVIDIMKLE